MFINCMIVIIVYWYSQALMVYVTGNIANYLKLLEVDSIYLPVPVNFILIGFDGKGNQGMKIH